LCDFDRDRTWLSLPILLLERVGGSKGGPVEPGDFKLSRFFNQAASIDTGPTRFVWKRIFPFGAGLGGGKLKTPAATLRSPECASQLFVFDRPEWQSWLQGFGSDCRVLHRGAGRPGVLGEAERIEPAVFPGDLWICLFKTWGFADFPQPAPTARTPNLAADRKRAEEKPTLNGESCGNDLEPAVFTKYLVLGLLGEELAA